MPSNPATVTDQKAYLFIGVYSAVLYSVLLIAPVVASMLATDLDLTPTSVGLVFSVELACFSLATIPAYLWLRKANVRTVTILCTAIVVVGNLLSAWTPSFEALLAIRGITSLAAGSITVLILSISAKTSNPSRAYGIFVVAQLAMGAVILLVFPVLYAGRTASAVYITLAVLATLTLPAAWCLQGNEFKKDTSTEPVKVVSKKNVFVFGSALVAVFGFYFALGGIWTFMAEIGHAGGVALETASSMLGIATVAGAAMALAASVVGEAKKANLYIVIGYVAMGIAMLMLYGGPGLVRYVVGALIFKLAWSWLLPFLLSVVSQIGGPHVMSSTNLMIGSGLGLSPVFAGRLIETSGGYELMIGISLVLLAIAFVASVVVMRSSTKAAVQREEPAMQPAM